MITYGGFYANSQLFETGKKFTKLFGGRFVGHVPDGRLFYRPQDRKSFPSRLSPNEETAQVMLKTLQDSIENNQNLIMERWPVLEYEPDCVY